MVMVIELVMVVMVWDKEGYRAFVSCGRGDIWLLVVAIPLLVFQILVLSVKEAVGGWVVVEVGGGVGQGEADQQ